jgi:hypothetical protein
MEMLPTYYGLAVLLPYLLELGCSWSVRCVVISADELVVLIE